MLPAVSMAEIVYMCEHYQNTSCGSLLQSKGIWDWTEHCNLSGGVAELSVDWLLFLFSFLSIWLKKKKITLWSIKKSSAQLVKNTLAMQETLVWFLGQEDPLEKG